MDRQALGNKIKQLEGLTNDEKSALLELLNSQKKYGLVWEDKPEEVEEQLREKIPVLTEVKERGILNDTETDKHPNHILIEGDNLHALTSLCYTHEGKIDVIYIDPPYNTGNKDFVYNDSFVDSEDSFRHSKWLSFMERRLKLAKRLLSEEGVIFISIDDNEAAQLKLLCDDIFSESNCIGTLIQNKLNAKNDTINIQRNHEYILVYRKQCNSLESTKEKASLIKYQMQEKTVFKEGDEFYYINDAITTRGDGGILNARPNLGYTVYFNPITKDKVAFQDYDVDIAKTSNSFDEVYTLNKELSEKGYLPIRPPRVRGKLGCWTWAMDKFNEQKNHIVITGSKDSFSVKKRTFINSDEVINDNGKLTYNALSRSNSKSIIEYSTNEGSNSLKRILGNSGIFNNPKNPYMIQYLIQLIPSSSITILDFFAGSGTTLHATMQLNATDGGHRQCILVTNNENNICEEVTYERNKRVINGYTTPKGVEVKGLSDNNLRYYRTNFIERRQTQRNKRQLVVAATDLLCIKENIYTEQTQFGSLKLQKQEARYFAEKGKQMLILFKEEIIDDFVEQIERLSFEGKLKIYIFAPGEYPYTDDFEEVLDKVELCALPDAIYKAYKQVLPTMKEAVVETHVVENDELNNDDWEISE